MYAHAPGPLRGCVGWSCRRCLPTGPALFTDLDKLVLDYAVAMSRTPVEVSDGLFARLRMHFDLAQLVELPHLIALDGVRGAGHRS